MDAVEPSDHFPDTILANGLEFSNFTEQSWAGNVQVIAENVQFMFALFRGKFGARDKLNIRSGASNRGARAAFGGIVVRKSDGIQAGALGVGDKFLG